MFLNCFTLHLIIVREVQLSGSPTKTTTRPDGFCQSHLPDVGLHGNIFSFLILAPLLLINLKNWFIGVYSSVGKAVYFSAHKIYVDQNSNMVAITNMSINRCRNGGNSTDNIWICEDSPESNLDTQHSSVMWLHKFHNSKHVYRARKPCTFHFCDMFCTK